MKTTDIILKSPPQNWLLKGFEGGSLPYFLGNLLKASSKTQILVTNGQKFSEKLKDEMQFFNPNASVEIFPAFDTLPYRGMSPNDHILHKQFKILSALLENSIDVLIIPLKALMRRYVPKSFFEENSFSLLQNSQYSLKELSQNLIQMGYSRETLVEDKGQFALRGDILDIFPPHCSHPTRLSFFDDELETLKTFDPVTQRTSSSISALKVIPAKEILIENILDDSSQIQKEWKSLLKKKTDVRHLQKTKRDEVEELIKNRIYFKGIESFLPLFHNKLNSIFDYLPSDFIITFMTAGDWQTELNEITQELKKLHNESDHIESIFSPKDLFLDADEILKNLDNKICLFETFHLQANAKTPEEFYAHFESNLKLKTQVSTQISKIHNLAPLASEINSRRTNGTTCLIVCQSLSQKIRFKDLLERFDLPIKVIENQNTQSFLDDLFQNKNDARFVYLLEGTLVEGFLDKENHFWWITDEEIFGKKVKRSRSKTQATQVFSSFSELTEGDFLVHMDHGVGLYKGLVNLDFDIYKNDFLAIEYLDKDKLYVPVDNLNRVQRFVTEEGAIPTLDKLGSPSWKKVQAKARKAARKLAAELLKIQAMRDSQVSYNFKEHTNAMEEFEATFEFEETPDQLHAITETLDDMHSSKPMDRLICGDVGYGKTEIALRATFLATQDQKQVAILVPTTVLAFQHYTTFKERFKNYPLKVELLSRFRSAKEQKEVIQNLKTGAVDIVVGTHRLLSKDITFRDLGLLIVDEEHRFGVIHKEKIKKFKSLIDVLTLTATPIPRTLNFALNGIRDLSIINTPPVDRLAIKTFACHFEPNVLRDAMLKELKRGGQIYFLHNRVRSIEKVTKKLKELMPEAKIRFGHGQMSEDELEVLMIDFMNHKFDILVCTTIIESGLDIPNANTMIIDRADQLGLAQLYQLRGRVGRSYRQAYCYLIVPGEDLITTKAKKRLATIQKFTELGSGFKVASHDLEIRGAGNILGDEQSGHIAAIGYDMYLKLLKEAIAELQNQDLTDHLEADIKLNISAKIPESYIADKQLRLILYKEISSASTEDELQNIKDSWLDRFGEFPKDVNNLFELIHIKILAKNSLVKNLKEIKNGLQLSFHDHSQFNPAALIQLIQSDSKLYAITKNQEFLIQKRFADHSQKFEFLKDFLKNLNTYQKPDS